MIGIQQKFTEAVKYFEMSAEHGNSHGMTDYGFFHCNVIGIQQKFTETAKNFEMTSNRGCSNEMYHYGMCCLFGEGVILNDDEGFKYIKKQQRWVK